MNFGEVFFGGGPARQIDPRDLASAMIGRFETKSCGSFCHIVILSPAPRHPKTRGGDLKVPVAFICL